MLEITRAEYLDILFNNSATKRVVEVMENTRESSITTLKVNNLERAMRIITSEGVLYFHLN